MNAFDIFVLIIVGYALIRGIFRGLIKEMAAIIGVAAGFWGAYTYYPLLADFLSPWIDNPGHLKIVSFLVIFCVVLLVVSIVGVVIKYLLRVAFLGWLDRICGGLFGLLKAVLITAVVLMALTAFLPKNAPLVRDSLAAPYITAISATLARITPGEFKTEFRDKLTEMRKSWAQKIH
ncbi:MAG: CvpA family protein [Desulfobacterales bacterium]|jgi:membrane protein required for colicin V production|nr:CvpA family protein [Desulfobacteraceae bacterium]MDD3991016.1 CvpA family protein [Desulfobacteraceae bacterium]MDY0311858.1 CvpA family protein [Desulfobacterales bacterium]